jgi:hypothetical protein
MERHTWYARKLDEDQDGVRFTGPVPGSRIVIVADDQNVVGGVFFQRTNSERLVGFRLNGQGDALPTFANSVETALVIVRDAFRDDHA